MNAKPQAAPVTPATPSSHPPTPAGPPRPWSRPWARATVMVVGFAIVMFAANSAAAAISHPVASLLVGPLLAAAVLWLYRTATTRIAGRPAIDVAPTGAGRRVLTGVVMGFLMATVMIGTIALLGGYEITGWGSLAGALSIAGMMFTVAVTEEVLFRGVIFQLVERRGGTWLALAVSSVLFGLVHLVNPSATLWGALAITIEAGLMLGAAYTLTRSLWLPIGLHLAWNTTIAAIFGTVTAGADAREALVTATMDGPIWLTGGAFGPEASLSAVLVCSLVTVALLVTARRRGRIVAARRSTS